MAASYTRRTVLVLDDDDAVRQSLEEFFEDQGWRVTAAATAEDALVLLAAERPNAAIVDVRLPGLSGDEFIRRALGGAEDLACIVCTASLQYVLPDDFRSRACVSKTVHHKPLRDMNAMQRELLRLLGAMDDVGQTEKNNTGS